jgi:hypothetical protein
VSQGNFLTVTAHAPLSFQEDTKLAFGDALYQGLYSQTIGVKAALNEKILVLIYNGLELLAQAADLA